MRRAVTKNGLVRDDYFKKALGLCRLTNDDIVYLRKWNATHWDSKFITVRKLRENYDLKATRVVWMQPRFEYCGPDYLGMEFGLYEGVR